MLGSPLTQARALGALALLTSIVSGLVGGLAGFAYGLAFILATAPGWPVGRTLFGRGPAAWVSGGLIGYGLTALAIWVPIALHRPSRLTFIAAWLLVGGFSYLACRRCRGPIVKLPEWDRRATLAMVFVLSLVPALVVLPYRNVGQVDEQGGHRYRAYFTADFVWHEALTAELARFDSPPRNPYMASQPLHYYWAYFLLPSAVTGAVGGRGASPPIESFLAVNALGAGMLFIGAVFLLAFATVPRPGVAAASVALTLLAASAEGLYQVIALLSKGLPVSAVRVLNIDAITAWFFYGLTVDGLPRSLWWGPQHATASALGLIALTVAARQGREMTPRAAAGAGTALSLAFLMSPFPAGAMTLTYAAAVLFDAARSLRRLPGTLLVQLIPGAMVMAALAWCIVAGTFEGAGSAVEIGLSRAATRDPATILGLALGPVLLPALLGAGIAIWRGLPRSLVPAIAGLLLAGLLFFTVTLALEPVWIGWRAGHHFLVVAPALIGLTITVLMERIGRAAASCAVAMLLVIGLPTTLIDTYNAQDTSNLAMGPGFRWTVRLSRGEWEALKWIEQRTPPDTLVQMSLQPRGRETWSLLPSFARRRMAAGLPISLLRTPEYDVLAARADRIYSAPGGDEAAQIARELHLDYIYVGRVERDAFGAAIRKFADRPDLFGTVFSNDDASVFVVF